MQQIRHAAGGLCVLLSILVLVNPAFGSQGGATQIPDEQVCDQAINSASRDFGVPRTVMKAVARTESGITVAGSFIPWPWTINIEGRGVRFSSKAEAIDYFRKSYADGARNIDLGCFQVNHRWHGNHFASVDDMLSPRVNARYAAKFLKELHLEFGDWTSAVGAFHSRTAEFSEKYLARYRPILKRLEGAEPKRNAPRRIVQKPNQFPLLKGTSQSRANGSLFPLATGAGRGLLTSSGVRG